MFQKKKDLPSVKGFWCKVNLYRKEVREGGRKGKGRKPNKRMRAVASGWSWTSRVWFHFSFLTCQMGMTLLTYWCGCPGN